MFGRRSSGEAQLPAHYTAIISAMNQENAVLAAQTAAEQARQHVKQQLPEIVIDIDRTNWALPDDVDDWDSETDYYSGTGAAKPPVYMPEQPEPVEVVFRVEVAERQRQPVVRSEADKNLSLTDAQIYECDRIAADPHYKATGEVPSWVKDPKVKETAINFWQEHSQSRVETNGAKT